MLASFPGFPSSFPSLAVREYSLVPRLPFQLSIVSRTASDGKLEGKPGNEVIRILQATESWKGSLGTRPGNEAWERGVPRGET